MSTRANFWIVNPNNTIQQYYCHFDGYFEGLGANLRNTILKALGLHASNCSKSTYEYLLSLIAENSFDPQKEECSQKEWEIEDCFDQTIINKLHGDIEYLYVVDCSDVNNIKLYGKPCHDLYNTFSFSKGTYTKRFAVKNIIADICREEHLLPLDKEL